MRYVLLLSIIVGSMFTTACPGSRNSAAEANKNAGSPKPVEINAPQNAAVPPTAPGTAGGKKSGDDQPPSGTADKPAVGIFQVVLSPFRYGQKKFKKQSFDFFENHVTDFNSWAEMKAGLEFDVVNQYGFLGKGRVVKFVAATADQSAFWEIEIVKGSLRNDLDKLAETRMGELEAEVPSLPAIGIFPSRPERKNIRSGERIDTSEKAIAERQAVYASLPEKIRDNADVYGEAGKLEYPNGWADLDGDRKIDYVYMRVRCADKPNSHCEKNLFRQADKWSELPEKIAGN